MLSSVARSAHSSGISVLRASSSRSSSSQSHPRAAAAAAVVVFRSARFVAAIGRTRGAAARSITSASSPRFSTAGALSLPLPSSARVQNKGARLE